MAYTPLSAPSASASLLLVGEQLKRELASHHLRVLAWVCERHFSGLLHILPVERLQWAETTGTGSDP